MTLDPRFIIASDLQSLFRDKDSAEPLSNGVIYFWKDPFRSEPKDVYKLAGTPPNYSYTNIGAVINLTSAGTMSDNENPANDIILYYFPYEGTPENSDGTAELYYVEVYSEGGKDTGVLQFTREAWPNFTTAESNTQNLINYIPNGQFKIHSDVEVDPTDTDAVPGQISQAITNLAQGGWTFERPDMSAATDIVLFQSFGGYVANPSASPTYNVEIECTSPSAGDDFKDLRIKFDDVNKFASDTEKYTFAFAGQGNGSNVSVSLILIKNFDDGSDPVETALANFVVTTSFTIIQTPTGFVFGDNTGQDIGPNNWLQLALRFPTGSLFSVSLTNFILTPGVVTITEFPQTTDREFAAQSITPAIPAYDSSNLYLYVQLGPQGLIYDDSNIGNVESETQVSVYVNSLHPTSNKLLADGSQYQTAAFSPIGIPFSRLQAKYWNTTLGMPQYGTGLSYFLGILNNVTNQIILTNNSPGIVTATADGAVTTGFTFSTVYTAIAPASGYFCQTVQNRPDGFYIVNDEPGNVGPGGTGTAPVSTSVFRIGSASISQITAFNLNSPVSAGQYFTFQTSNGGAQDWYVWFQVDGTGSDPAPGGTGILVNVHSGDNLVTEAIKITTALNNWQTSSILTTAASAVNAGSYFTANAITPGGTQVLYYVWYKKDGSGTDPKPSGRIGIEVDILSADTAAQVAQKTQIAINQKFFAVPDLRGYFLRGWDNGSDNDPDASERYSVHAIGLIGDQIGTREFDTFASHDHNVTLSNNTLVARRTTGGTEGPVAAGEFTYSTIGVSEDEVGGTTSQDQETRPINQSVNYAIRY